MATNSECAVLCNPTQAVTTMTEAQSKTVIERIKHSYYVHLWVDYQIQKNYFLKNYQQSNCDYGYEDIGDYIGMGIYDYIKGM